MISVSIVSHGQCDLLRQILPQLAGIPEIEQILVTHNLPNPASVPQISQIDIVQNQAPLGFGANHNNAFKRATGRFFCVLNPDIALIENPFPALMHALENEQIGLVCPMVISHDGELQDNLRAFPTLGGLVGKLFGSQSDRCHVPPMSGDQTVPWCAGMFMFFPASAFRAVGGFDSRFFLYYEDVDLCARLRLAGFDIQVVTTAQVIHDARRDSHRRLRYFAIHVSSIWRYFMRYRFGYSAPVVRQ